MSTPFLRNLPAACRHASARRAATLGAAMLLGACTMGPDWHKPSPTLPSHYQPPTGPLAPSQTSDATPAPAWWDILNDPTLSALERRLVSSNLDLAEAATRLASSRAERRVIGAAQYPTADANASYARERASPNGVLGLLGTTEQQSTATVANGSSGFGPTTLPGSTGSAPFDLWQYGFDASWELDLWGRTRRAVEAADAAVEVSADMRRGMLVSLQAEMARDYLQLRGVQAEIAITQSNLGNALHGQQLTEMRFRNGATTQLDVANASAHVATVRAALPPLQRAEAQLVNALSFLLGQPPRALAEELSSPRPIPPAPPRVPVGLPSELARERPDIRAAEAQLHAATAQIGIAMADFYPRITLSGSLDIQALQFSNLGSWNSRQYGIGPSVSLPLFEAGRLHGTLELRKAQQKQAAINYQRTVLRAWHEVDDALTAYNAAQNQRDQIRDAVTQNQAALSMAELQYKQGAADYLNVLAVQNQLFATQRMLAQATTDTDVALASLYKALGGGWQQIYPAGPPSELAVGGGAATRLAAPQPAG